MSGGFSEGEGGCVQPCTTLLALRMPKTGTKPGYKVSSGFSVEVDSFFPPNLDILRVGKATHSCVQLPQPSENCRSLSGSEGCKEYLTPADNEIRRC